MNSIQKIINITKSQKTEPLSPPPPQNPNQIPRLFGRVIEPNLSVITHRIAPERGLCKDAKTSPIPLSIHSATFEPSTLYQLCFSPHGHAWGRARRGLRVDGDDDGIGNNVSFGFCSVWSNRPGFGSRRLGCFVCGGPSLRWGYRHDSGAHKTFRALICWYLNIKNLVASYSMIYWTYINQSAGSWKKYASSKCSPWESFSKHDGNIGNSHKITSTLGNNQNQPPISNSRIKPG